MKGILLALFTPYNPFWGYDSIGKTGKIQFQDLVAFVFVLGVAVTGFHLLRPFQYRTAYLYLMSSSCFLIGFGLKLLLTTFTLSLGVSAATKTKFGFHLSFPIVILAASTLLYPFIFYRIDTQAYIVSNYLSQLWFFIILSVGIWKKSELSLFRSLALALFALMLYFLIVTTMVPYGMKF